MPRRANMLHANREEPLLEARGVGKRFGATVALRDFDLSLYPAEIHALLGENGAGKSTFIKILAGLYEANTGTVARRPRYAGRPKDIAFIHQDLDLVPTMTVAENFGLVSGFCGPAGLVNRRALFRAAAESLDRLGVQVDPSMLVAELTVGDRALVSIARALHTRSDVVVLDEPTASLPAADVERLFDVLRALCDEDVAILYVSHRLSEVLSLADRITVLRDGEKQATVDADKVTERDLATLIVGRDIGDVYPTRTAASENTLLQVQGLQAPGLAQVSFELRRGEVLGLTGLRGAGQEVIGRALYGTAPAVAKASFDGRPYRAKAPHEALRRGVGFVSGDRSASLAPSLTVRENLFLNPDLSSGGSYVRLPRQERARASALIEEFHIVPPEPNRELSTLSGGNAQKVALARSMASRPQLLILEEPTAGVDVGSRAEFYRLIRQAAARGVGVLLTSSDYEEIAETCNRVLVFARSHLVTELRATDITVERISTFAMGGYNLA